MPESKEETWRRGEYVTFKPVLNTNAHLVNMIHEYLQKEKDNICIFENFEAKKSDPWSESRKVNLFFYKDEVYHLLSNKNFSTRSIDQELRWASTVYHFMGVMSSLPIENQKTTESHELSDTEWDIVVSNLKRIIVGAYDGESYLIWGME